MIFSFFITKNSIFKKTGSEFFIAQTSGERGHGCLIVGSVSQVLNVFKADEEYKKLSLTKQTNL